MIISSIFFLKKSVILNTYASEFLQVAKHSKTHTKNNTQRQSKFGV